MNFFRKRFREASTYGGFAGIVAGLGLLLKVDEAPAIADAVAQGGQAIVTGQTGLGVGAIVAGILGALLADRDDRQG